MSEAPVRQVGAGLADYPLLSALLDRRTRRFGRGMKMGGGPLAYSSTEPPAPLTLDEEAALAFAACGFTGRPLGELDYTSGTLQSGGGNILAGFGGRTIASGDAVQSVAVIVINDDGAWLLPRPQDLALGEVDTLVAMARERRLVDVYQRSRIRLADRRVSVPPDMPYSPPFNRWDANVSGSTYFLPVMELSGLYLNMLLSAFSPELGTFMRDDKNGYRPAGIGRFAKSKGGQLHDAATPLGYVGTVTYLETALLQFVTVELGAVLQNLALMTQALGLGGFTHAAVHPQWMTALGFISEDVSAARNCGFGVIKRTLAKLLGKDIGIPTAIGLEREGRTLIKTYCPPRYFRSMEEAVTAWVGRKFSSGGIFRNGGVGTPWKDGAAVAAGVQPYADDAVAATIAYAEYVYGRYGRFPVTTAPIATLVAYQAHRLDPAFYDRFYPEGALSPTQLRRDAD